MLSTKASEYPAAGTDLVAGKGCQAEEGVRLY